jgi:hypothetical protein
MSILILHYCKALLISIELLEVEVVLTAITSTATSAASVTLFILFNWALV